jgi:RNA polymerase sigma-70 factor (ECF subfamily)
MAPESIQLVSAALTWMSAEAGPATPAAATPAGQELTDGDLPLVRLAQAGDHQAFGQLVDRNRRAVYRTALAALGSGEEADEVAQETFVAVFVKLHTFRGESSFRTWLLTIAWRRALTRRRRVTRWLRTAVVRTSDDEGADLLDRMPSPGASPHDGLVRAELERTIRRLVRSLPRKLRDALLLAGSGEYSYDQIAGMLKIPVGTVKWRVSEARRVLRKKLDASGYAHD